MNVHVVHTYIHVLGLVRYGLTITYHGLRMYTRMYALSKRMISRSTLPTTFEPRPSQLLRWKNVVGEFCSLDFDSNVAHEHVIFQLVCEWVHMLVLNRYYV